MRLKIIALTPLLIVAIACSHVKLQRLEEKRIAQPVIFHYSFVNFAWGYQNRGWFIIITA
jgi:hypothetical protein